MEEQLVRLSTKLRIREEEVDELKRTVQEQCHERGELMRAMAIMRASSMQCSTNMNKNTTGAASSSSPSSKSASAKLTSYFLLSWDVDYLSF